MAKPNLEDYIEVPDRIRAFKDAFPEGSLQATWHTTAIAEQTLIICEARAYRTADDPRPGIGTASEPFPGTTPYTRNSELMNAETSAWGRALAALGFVAKKIATKEDVEARQAEANGREQKVEKPSDIMPVATISREEAGDLYLFAVKHGIDWAFLRRAVTYEAKVDPGDLSGDEDEVIEGLRILTEGQAAAVGAWMARELKKREEKAEA